MSSLTHKRIDKVEGGENAGINLAINEEENYTRVQMRNRKTAHKAAKTNNVDRILTDRQAIGTGA